MIINDIITSFSLNASLFFFDIFYNSNSYFLWLVGCFDHPTSSRANSPNLNLKNKKLQKIYFIFCDSVATIKLKIYKRYFSTFISN
ncbi:hypothetical protein BpHYR1_045548 [Brachionus plicatilis]|uniref:Uncharacterized protein n=1 Tax=Brachionus plicatilis TaxID=10195 RepID=A0A3M7Q6Q3_BRAPC|nr:hypothetical protein BpHYR1_045548 [Brachionus plicatilis]